MELVKFWTAFVSESALRIGLVYTAFLVPQGHHVRGHGETPVGSSTDQTVLNLMRQPTVTTDGLGPVPAFHRVGAPPAGACQATNL